MAGPPASGGKPAPIEKSLPPRLEGDLLEIAQSLSVEDTPAKLRCASCNKLAVEAWKLPCCDQNICEACRNSLPAECPVCMHSPLTPDVCSPNRSLRLTIRAHCMSIRSKRKAQQEMDEAAQYRSTVLTPPANIGGDPTEDIVSEDAPVAAALSVADDHSMDLTAIRVDDAVPQTTALDFTARAAKASLDREETASDCGSDCNTVFDLFWPRHQYAWYAQMNEYRKTARLPERPIDKALIKSHMDSTEQELNVLQQSVQTSNMRVSDQRPVSRRSSDQSNPQSAERPSQADQEAEPDENHDQDQHATTSHNQNQANQMLKHGHGQGQSYAQGQHFPHSPGFGHNQQYGGIHGFGQNQGYGQGFGGMDTNGMDFNAMMQMQMQWMGMPGMNMNDPSMMFGGGFGGMNGMTNMMNMGMGAMGGMNAFGGMPDMGGMNGGAYFPQNGGYNQQQNFGASSMMNDSNSYPQNNRGYSGRAQYNNRGGAYARGGRGNYNRGRGGWQNYEQQHQYQGQHVNTQYPQTPQSFRGNDENSGTSVQQGATRGSPSYEPTNGRNGTVTDAKVLTSSLESETHGVNDKGTYIDETNRTGNATTKESTNEPEKGGGVVSEEGRNGVVAGDIDSGARVAAVSDGIHHSSLQSQAPPVNAPTGPKAMRQGQPSNSRFSRPQQSLMASAVAAPAIELEHSKASLRDTRSRSRSRSPSHSNADRYADRHMSRHKIDEPTASYEPRDDREHRKRKSRPDHYDETEDKPTKKARSESPEDGRSKHRHRQKDETRHSSRSHRESSRDRRKDRRRSRSPKEETSVNGDERRKDRQRSRSPRREKDVKDDGHDSARRKSRSDKKREDEHEIRGRKERDRDHKHSSRHHEDDERQNKERAGHSRRYRESMDSKHRYRDYERTERERDRRRSAIEDLAQDGGEFKIKGRSAMHQGEKATSEVTRQHKHDHEHASEKRGDTRVQADPDRVSMRPPSTLTSDRGERRSSAPVSHGSASAVDIYAEEREKARKAREEMQLKRVEGRRVSSQSIGKRSRDDDGFDAPTGPSGDQDRMRGSKRAKTDMRKHSLKFEGEIGGHHDSYDNRRYR